jgi:hypothetical protein
MSSAILQGGATGTGSVTILAPNTNSNQILTLPDATGTIVTNKTAGTVLQVVQATTTSTGSTSGSTPVDTTLTATITPTSATSKILVMVSQPIQIYVQSNVGVQGNLNIVRGSTTIATYNSTNFSQFATGANGYQDSIYTTSLQYLDSPATTSSTTYKTQGFVTTSFVGNYGIRWNTAGYSGTCLSTIILMEIAG